jgi:hypothetical protein
VNSEYNESKGILELNEIPEQFDLKVINEHKEYSELE